MTASAPASLPIDPVARDHTGRELHLHDRIIAPEDDSLSYTGRIVRLHRTRGHDLARVQLDTGSEVEITTGELAQPCRECDGEGGRTGYSPQGLADPQTEELCPRCEGDGIEPGGER